VLFHKYSGQTDVVLGTVMAGRDSGLAENAVGCFVNTLAIRTRFKPSDTFAMLVKQVKQLILDAQEHQNYPLHRIENRLNALGGASVAPLFNVMVDMMFIDPGERVALTDGAVMTPVLYSYGKSKYDLTLYLLAGSGGITVIYEYRTALFKPATIRALAQRWGRLLARLLATADREIRDVESDDLPGLPAIRRRRI
jgi:non-ribosomal peptide synthetase component F